MEIVKRIKKYRVELDKAFSVMGLMTGSREISIAITSAQNSKMWLGQVLKRLNEENPYPDSKNASNTKIAPTADVWDGNVEDELVGIGHIQKIKQLRKELSDIADEIEKDEIESQFSGNMDTNSFHCLTTSWNYMTEATMWLGMELGRINKKNKK